MININPKLNEIVNDLIKEHPKPINICGDPYKLYNTCKHINTKIIMNGISDGDNDSDDTALIEINENNHDIESLVNDLDIIIPDNLNDVIYSDTETDTKDDIVMSPKIDNIIDDDSTEDYIPKSKNYNKKSGSKFKKYYCRDCNDYFMAKRLTSQRGSVQHECKFYGKIITRTVDLKVCYILT